MLALAWSLLLDTAPYVLVGFCIAALLDGLLRGDRWLGRLSGRGFGATALATLIGAPLPLCSCSVLPAALTLRKRGLGRGPTLAFLVSTPETSVTSVLLSYSLLGPVYAVLRPVAAVVTAIAAGLVEGVFGRDDNTVSDEVDCCDDDHHHAHDDAPVGSRVQRGLRFAFVDLFDDLFGWIIFGILVAAALSTWIPAESLSALFTSPWLTLLIVLVLGVPLYVCAEASTPIAAALIAQGMSPGAALVFLLVGPATNLGSLGALERVFGRRSVVLYLASIVVVALALGIAVDSLIGAQAVRMTDTLDAQAALVPPALATLSALAFLALGLVSMVRRDALGLASSALSRMAPFAVSRRATAMLAIVTVLAAWASTGVATVPPGHVGVVQRFGAVIVDDAAPGLLLRLPAPIETITVVPTARVRRTELRTLDEFLTGDENLGDLSVAVHWTTEPSAMFDVSAPKTLVRSVATTALCEELAGTPINTALTHGRAHIEREVQQRAQAHLDRYRTGITLASITITSAHAPAPVHDAFRDVAGAVEDRRTSVEHARAREARTVPTAHAEAAMIRANAEGEALTVVAHARADAARFGELLEASHRGPEVTRRRLEFETIEAILPRWRKYFRDSDELDVWFSAPALPERGR